MAFTLLIPASEAATFTLGCALIHAYRPYAERLASILMLVALALMLAIALVVTPQELLNAAAEAEVLADLGASAPSGP